MTVTTYSATGVIALLIAGGAFYGGMTYEKNASKPRERSGQGQFVRFGGGEGQRFAVGRGQNGMNGTAGTILSKDDRSITIKLPDGSTKIVLVASETKVVKSIDGNRADLQKDAFVTVSGNTQSNGTITASTIRIGGPELRRDSASTNK